MQYFSLSENRLLTSANENTPVDETTCLLDTNINSEAAFFN